MMSDTRSRCWRVDSMRRSAAFFLALYLVMPAASSMRPTPLLGPRRDDEPDPALLDDGVSLGADARAQEELDHVTQTARDAVQEVVALPVAEQPAGHDDFGGADCSPGNAPGGRRRIERGSVEGQRDLGEARRPSRLRAREDHVLHGASTQVLGGLLTHHPADGVHDVRLAAAVRTHDRRDFGSKMISTRFSWWSSRRTT
jgi:hypothetical protein